MSCLEMQSTDLGMLLHLPVQRHDPSTAAVLAGEGGAWVSTLVVFLEREWLVPSLKSRPHLRFEPRTSHTLSKDHTPSTTSHGFLDVVIMHWNGLPGQWWYHHPWRHSKTMEMWDIV